MISTHLSFSSLFICSPPLLNPKPKFVFFSVLVLTHQPLLLVFNMDSLSNTTSSPSTSPSTSDNSPLSPSSVVASPCAACKILRRKCAEKCVLAPYFPPSEPLKFTTAHRVFGASNIIKFLQELPESQRADAVSSMVYEANARIRDPVYGCAGVICNLQKQVNDLQVQLAMNQAELVNIQCQNANLTLIYMDAVRSTQTQTRSLDNILQYNGDLFLDDNNVCSQWEPLWT